MVNAVGAPGTPDAIVIDKVLVAIAPAASVTCTVKLFVVADSPTVPEITPDDEIDNPDGSVEPVANAQLLAPEPPIDTTV